MAAAARDPNVYARVIVSSDSDLTDLGPIWGARLMMRPRDFVRQAM